MTCLASGCILLLMVEESKCPSVPWIMAFVGCSIVIGMWILNFFVLTMVAIEAGGVAVGSEMQLVRVTATLFIILGTGLVILFRRRSRFWRLSHIIQWMIAVGMIISYLASIVVAFQLIRGSWG